LLRSKSCVRHKDVESVADQVADLSRKRVSAIRRGEIGGNRIGASARCADFDQNSD